ncbi:SDR family oxidoreductase [Cellulomonas alba]|uniref:SDR family oxidoreductase n=1 Tax=Cellulomonas alba TaxID=3053467 RepID=A0ABT7SFL1_9CELL|nr:SDR family oxidoreductase [Cellulomonas alba]MDM7854977.1 SDR family oxidoreductase [Cellulomonas alba]
MRLVVIGGTGRIGAAAVEQLRSLGHEAVAASPSAGVDAYTGAGLADALAGADVVVDVSNAPASGLDPLTFFTTSTRNLLAGERAAGVRHHVVLSIVGVDRAADSPYLGAKLAQERVVEAADVPFTILRATQFFEFLAAIADRQTHDGVVRSSTGAVQPVAASEVVEAVVDLALGPPLGGVVDVAGPERFALDQLLRAELAAAGDPRPVVGDPQARYAGALLGATTIVPTGAARLGTVTLTEWRAARTVTR